MKQSMLQDSRTNQQVSLSQAIKTSQPYSGGLWSLTQFPQISSSELDNLKNSSYQQLAYHILSQFDFGVSQQELLEVINKAYGTQWHDEEITPVKKIKSHKLYSLHLGFGPTFAFKNIALEFLPRLLSLLTKGEIIHVLGASSGDTINAAHSGVKGTNIKSIFMLPSTGPSKVQRLQAVNGIIDNPNALTILADLPFDPLQDIVKKINGQDFKDFKEQFNITSFNSINIARILAQIVYYFRAYTKLLQMGEIQNGDEIIYSVPSGNFGDALAGYYAKKMGLPIGKILIATNENDMLDKFFKTGIYQPPKKGGEDFVQVTNAPSMDIAKSSNFERMLFDICDYDYAKIKGWYDELAKTGKFQVDQETLTKIQKIFISSTSNDKERLTGINTFGTFLKHGIDPHTAAGIVPWLKNEHDLTKAPVVFLETSHVAQFGEELQEKGIIVPGMETFDKTIDAMKLATPIEGTHYLRTTGEFNETFAQIQKAINEILTAR